MCVMKPETPWDLFSMELCYEIACTEECASFIYHLYNDPFAIPSPLFMSFIIWHWPYIGCWRSDQDLDENIVAHAT